MAEIVYGEQALSEPLQKLVALLGGNTFGGTLYVGYPILSSIEGAIRVDALYVSKSSGVVIFDASHLEVTEGNAAGIEDIRQLQDRYFAAINSKLIETPELLVRRTLVVPITIISISTNDNFQADDVIVCTVEAIPEKIPNDSDLSDNQFRILNSVIERTATIRPQKKRTNVTKQHSRGAVLRQI
jgi:superfamily I DNA and RNA helicase